MNPFEEFSSGEYNESLIALEIMKIVEENGLANTVTGVGVKIPAPKIYAVLELDSDALETTAQSKHINANKLIQYIIDKLRERTPEEILLSTIVKKRGTVELLDNYERNKVSNTPAIPVIAPSSAMY